MPLFEKKSLNSSRFPESTDSITPTNHLQTREPTFYPGCPPAPAIQVGACNRDGQHPIWQLPALRQVHPGPRIRKGWIRAHRLCGCPGLYSARRRRVGYVFKFSRRPNPSPCGSNPGPAHPSFPCIGVTSGVGITGAKAPGRTETFRNLWVSTTVSCLLAQPSCAPSGRGSTTSLLPIHGTRSGVFTFPRWRPLRSLCRCVY